MKYTRKEKRIYVLLFSMSCFLIIFALYKNLGSSPSNGLRNLIESKDVERRCGKEREELENEYKKDPHSFDLNITKKDYRVIPGGPYENLEARRFKKAKNPEWNDFEYRFLGKKPSPNFELSKQELYVRVEAPKGELGIYLVGDDSLFPWRWKIRPPGFINLQILPQLVKKMKLADIMTILGSIDIIMGEVDR